MKCYAIRDLTATWEKWYSCLEELDVYLVQFTWNIMKDWGSNTNHSGGLHHVLWTETCNVNCGQSGGVSKVLLSTNTYTYDLSVWWFVLILSELENFHLQPLTLCILKCFFNENNSAQFDGIADVMFSFTSNTREDLQFLLSMVTLESELWCSDLQIETKLGVSDGVRRPRILHPNLVCVWNLVSVSV
jgi:hypothetical protein